MISVAPLLPLLQTRGASVPPGTSYRIRTLPKGARAECGSPRTDPPSCFAPFPRCALTAARALAPLARLPHSHSACVGDKAVKYGAITRAYGYAVMRAHDGRELKTF